MPNDRPRLLWMFPEAVDDAPELISLLDSFAQTDVRHLDRAELLRGVGEYQILVPRLSDEINSEILDCGTRLRMIGTPSTGSDHIAVAEAKRRGIEVITIKEDREFLDSVQATAELAWLLIQATSRNFRAAIDHVLEGGWETQTMRGHELIGRTIGIVGYGRLGTMVSRFARAFRMNVIATDIVPIVDDWVTQLPLNELLGAADIVTLHLHLNDQTRGMIGREQIGRMKRGAILVNTSRGGIIDEQALLDALSSGHLSAAGLDVIQGERDADRNTRPLLQYARKHQNLIVTPHVGGCTLESQSKAFVHFANKLRTAWLSHAGV